MSRNGRQGISGNPRAQEQMKSRERQEQRQREDDLRALLALPAGRRFLWHLIDTRCAYHGTGFSLSGSEMYFLAGKRDVAAELRRDLQDADMKGYAAMLHEALVEEADRRIRRTSAESKAKEDDEGAEGDSQE